MYKQGAFVNILTSDSNLWKMSLKKLEQLPLLNHIELWLEHIPKGHELKEIRSAFRNIALTVHGPFLHISLVSHIPALVAVTEERFDAALEFASKVEARVVTFHAGTYPSFEPKDQVLDKLANRFGRFTSMTDPVATLENMPLNSHGTTKQAIGHLSDCEEILKLIPNLRFTLDIGHSLQNEDDFVAFLQKFSARVENIHLHDGVPLGKSHLRLGAGRLDLNRFLDTLLAVSFDKFIGLETISFEDTKSSWETLCKAESAKGIGHPGCAPQ